MGIHTYLGRVLHNFWSVFDKLIFWLEKTASDKISDLYV